MGTGFAKKKKQARALQEQYLKMQDTMKQTEVVGTAGNGLVSVQMTGEFHVSKVTIKPECVDPEEVEALEDLVKAAIDHAVSQLLQNQMPAMGNLGALGFGG